MRLILSLIAIALLGWRLWMEYEHGQVLEVQLDEARKELAVYQQQQAQALGASRTPGQWMWGKDPGNPLNYPAVRFGQPQQRAVSR
jgi:hypothetical protein